MFGNKNITTKELLKSVRQIEIKTSRIVNSYFSGQYHSAFKGHGIEFDEVRKYSIGDDVRAMDWKVSARYNEPFIKRFREERELNVIILADFSASTNFGFTKTKHNLIVEVSALLTFSALKNNDKVGLLIFTDTVEKFIPLGKGRNHVLRIIRELIEFEPKNIKTNIKEILKSLSKAKNITIIGHRNPDVDCICSCLGLSLLLKKIFKKRTGITAFLSKEIFFTTSYNPNKVAETKASNNHIVSNINLSTIQFYKVGYASLRQSILRKKRKRFTACPNRRTIISALPMRYRNPTPASFIYKQDVYQKSGAKIK